MGLLDAEPVEHRQHVVARAVLAVHLRILGHVGWRVAAGAEGDTAMGARKMAELRLP